MKIGRSIDPSGTDDTVDHEQHREGDDDVSRHVKEGIECGTGADE